MNSQERRGTNEGTESQRQEKADDVVIRPETGRNRGRGPGCVRGTDTPAESQDAPTTAGPVKGASSLSLPGLWVKKLSLP